ncbi:MAG: beta-ketoacyl-[acyl-carrier-protein] synthase II [Planctomycetaceae bacterium]|nr:MAG: beta-ketoacyl-[acyl-carrier-protein] synthase II [Planctomycetaceae bacterium]
MGRRRIVLTGLGTVNPLGRDVAQTWDALLSGKSGIGRIQKFDPLPFASQIGGEVVGWDGVPSELVDVREGRRMDRFSQFAVTAAIEAVRDSGIDFQKEDRLRCGVIYGSGIGGLQELEEQHNRMLEKGPSRVSPFTVPKLMVNAAPGNIAIIWNLMGPNTAVVTACASAANAIGDAMRCIQRDECDIVISGGSEAALTQIGLASFCALKGLSTRNDDPTRASRPWDKDRDGFLLSEGAGAVILEELEHAKARGAKIYGELIGFGASCDGYHITAPDPEGKGAILAMQRALKDGGVAPEQVEYINAHGTSTELGDLAETRAVKKTFGDYAKGGLMVSSTKSSHGHLLGASGALELIITALGMQNSVVPATMNLDNPDAECDLDFVPNTPRNKSFKIAMSNSFGFGGHNACLVLKKFED